MSFLAVAGNWRRGMKATGNESVNDSIDNSIYLSNDLVRDRLLIKGIGKNTGSIEVEFYDIQGRKVVKDRLELKESGFIDVPEELSGGIYFIRIRNGDRKYTDKFTLIR